MEGFFKLKEHDTSVRTEIIAGLTTFFAMAYIIFVNPSVLSTTGMPWGGVFLATIISSAISTLVMGLVANVPYALAPGMGLNSMFAALCLYSGFTWQETLGMVFICGVINILITVTKVRKLIIKAIPLSLQNAIGGGIGAFIAYLGLYNAGLLNFFTDPIENINDSVVVTGQSIATFNEPGVILAVIGIIIMTILMVRKVKGAIFIGIIATTIIGIPMGVVDLSSVSISFDSVGQNFKDLGMIFGAVFTKEGIGSLFSDPSRIPFVLISIFTFSLADTFDTIGTFIGTGRRTGIFDAEDEKALEASSGFKSKMDKALFADAIGTSVGAVLGTSNTTTYVESAAGIAEGGRTGLTAVTVSVMMLLSMFLAPITGLVPAEATAPALIIVGVLMAGAFADINWGDFSEALPAFFAGLFMAFFYSVSEGIAVSFIFYCIVKTAQGKAKEVSPILWGASVLFIINYVLQAI